MISSQMDAPEGGAPSRVKRKRHVGGAAAVLLMCANCLWAQSDTKVESSRAVTSPDQTRTVVVDRFTPVVDGQPERFSGRMLVRVKSADGSQTRQRYIEASQVRVIQPPVWVDDSRVCAFVYNVAKNSNGIVYFEPETNRALQVEFVMPSRQMAASGKVEQELTSLEVTEFSGQDVFRTRNVPWHGGSAFPLVLPPLPEFEGRPYDVAFLNSLNTAIQVYKEFLKKHNLTSLEPEQASESFNGKETWLGLLACGGADSFLLGVPLKQTQPTAVLDKVRIARVPDLMLACSQRSASEGGEQSMIESRFLTAWEDMDTLQVMKESYGTETEAPLVEPVFSLDAKTGKAAAVNAGDSKTSAPL